MYVAKREFSTDDSSALSINDHYHFDSPWTLKEKLLEKGWRLKDERTLDDGELGERR